jgi:Ser/Thr protein kinase RdoA (MazF antagonist)
LKDRDRERFQADELAVVLSHYDLGVIESITEFSRGSRRSPKVGMVCQRGKFLLKRRDPDRTSRAKIAFTHGLQAHLGDKGFPLPVLVRPVDANGENDTVLAHREHLYELFEYVPGHSYCGTPGETRDAGRTLAQFHTFVRDFDAGENPPYGDYHDATAVRTGLSTIPSTVSAHESVAGKQAELLGTTQTLFDAYDEAADAVREAGIDEWPVQVVHSDWHPGNMLFKHDQVVAVIDYDSARLARRVLDVANGALQFSILSGDRPEEWPDHLDEDRMKQFLGGYEEIDPLTGDERRCIPYLMIEAIIAESVVPIAMTGSFGRWQGFRFMQMVRRKVLWLQSSAERLTTVLQP